MAEERKVCMKTKVVDQAECVCGCLQKGCADEGVCIKKGCLCGWEEGWLCLRRYFYGCGGKSLFERAEVYDGGRDVWMWKGGGEMWIMMSEWCVCSRQKRVWIVFEE